MCNREKYLFSNLSDRLSLSDAIENRRPPLDARSGGSDFSVPDPAGPPVTAASGTLTCDTRESSLRRVCTTHQREEARRARRTMTRAIGGRGRGPGGGREQGLVLRLSAALLPRGSKPQRATSDSSCTYKQLSLSLSFFLLLPLLAPQFDRASPAGGPWDHETTPYVTGATALVIRAIFK